VRFVGVVVWVALVGGAVFLLLDPQPATSTTPATATRATPRSLTSSSPQGTPLHAQAIPELIVPDLNPDGHVHGYRQNAHGVDLNRNWSSGWQPGGRPWDFEYPGLRPFSELETRIARNLIERIKPQVTIWYHQHLNLVWAWGPSSSAGRIYARVAGMRFYHHPWLAGTAPNWQNHHYPRSASFVVEHPAGTLTTHQVRQQVQAVLTLAAQG
jgi:protein MpaA